MRTFVKWFGYGALSLVALILIAVAYFYWKSNRILNTTYPAADVTLDLPPADSTVLARGRHLSITLGCTDCHGSDFGGLPTMDAMPVAYIPASNLTPAGVAAGYSDADWIRAIRHGIGPDGRSLWIMPSAAYSHLSPSDLAALIAFLKQADPVDRALPPKQFGPIGRMLVANGAFKLAASRVDQSLPFAAAPPAGPTAEYGEYLSYPCRYCHGRQLNGGLTIGPPDAPSSSNLTPAEDGLAGYTAGDFVLALREGKKKDGTQMDALYMPWQATSAMTDDEIAALWAYLQTLDPLPTGGP